MKIPRETPAQRLVVALVTTAIVVLVVWGVWMAVLLVLGVVGWALTSIGNALSGLTRLMGMAHGTVAIVGIVCGALLGGLLASDLSLDGLRNRLEGKPKTAETPPAPADSVQENP